MHDLASYVALPRLSGLVLSPDGTRLVTGVSELSPDGAAYRTALWQVDTAAEQPARRLTRGAKSESAAAFTPDGDLLFTSARPDQTAEAADGDTPAALWRLPASGEAYVVATRPGGVGGIRVASSSGRVLLASDTFPDSTDAERDQEVRTARSDRKISAILHDAAPVRHWDHDLGPGWPRLFLADNTDDADDSGAPGTDERLDLHDLTPTAGRALHEGGHDVSPDGATVVTTWNLPEPGGYRTVVVAIDTSTGERRSLAGQDDPEVEYGSPVISPDGAWVCLTEHVRSRPDRTYDVQLVVVPIDGSASPRRIAEDWDRWPSGPVAWTPDGSALLVPCDEDGRGRIHRIPVDGGDPVRLTGDDATYTDVCVSPDGRTAYALRTSYAAPAHPVRLDTTTPDQTPVALPAPHPDRLLPELPGTLTEVETTGEDGARVRSWLCLPHGASAATPAPLLLWIHGGPVGSWNAWSWRWNPWLAVSRGYAVLLPDPALSTGYGREFVQRGWGQWGGASYTDLMAATDAALERDDLDAERTAAMGGSYGGYMANWVAGHTDRFDAIVTHASLWALDQFGPTTDAPFYWRREMTEQMERANSPHRFVDDIVSPMLVIHGDKDYRVPIGEGLRLWAELAARAEPDGTMPHRFLYFPDENHWILTPGNAQVWYECVFAFLDQHVRGEAWRTPELLA
ncbi:alpha/beta fold hydrolase [Nocardioidaceae bacterium]|nr:alpha/beta fold hydrolase [Nocardioidaceae bacterium]